MTELVLDTHALIWYLASSPRLSHTAAQAIRDAISRGHRLAISAISLAEVLYLEEKGRFLPGTLAAIRTELQAPGTALEEAPLSGDVVDAMRRVPRDKVPDMPDRVVAATAVHLGVPLVTEDAMIHASGIPVIW
ncbi:MAG TPA: type II toxin-antitoxin system VapC family toxin [Tepidisphaeraceae bacterium]